MNCGAITIAWLLLSPIVDNPHIDAGVYDLLNQGKKWFVVELVCRDTQRVATGLA
jgi:hypothetical protein